MVQPNLVTHRPRSLILLGLLLSVALSLGAVSIPAAQAARAADLNKNIYLFVTKAGSAERTICVGDKVDISVRVLAVVEVLNDPNAEKQFAPLIGVPLQASVTNPSVGVISPAASATTVSADPIGQATFIFTAQKAGTTTIQVDGKLIHNQLLGVVLSSDTVTGKLALTVETCAYRVDATGVWHQEGKITLIAEITDAALAPLGDGKYAGNADVKWFGEFRYPPPCYVVMHPAPSRAYITGTAIGTDLLEVKMNFEATPAMFSTIFCPKSNSVDMFAGQMLTPESLRLWVLTSGGTSRRKPSLGGIQVLDGTAIVTVIPVKGQ